MINQIKRGNSNVKANAHISRYSYAFESGKMLLTNVISDAIISWDSKSSIGSLDLISRIYT
jgi:hypothetical protein